ncbi:hypothetical protein [Blastopirellula marina]|uniref:hypothetical protein n=1 Tax=Blastopirellula marina TaxID=124 RepID=UPI0010390A0D|nr:hypothetical protein [Blastopirellula marina]
MTDETADGASIANRDEHQEPLLMSRNITHYRMTRAGGAAHLLSTTTQFCATAEETSINPVAN